MWGWSPYGTNPGAKGEKDVSPPLLLYPDSSRIHLEQFNKKRWKRWRISKNTCPPSLLLGLRDGWYCTLSVAMRIVSSNSLDSSRSDRGATVVAEGVAAPDCGVCCCCCLDDDGVAADPNSDFLRFAILFFSRSDRERKWLRNNAL